MAGRDKLGQFTKALFDMDWILGKSIPVTESGCWIWEGYQDPKTGYGKYRTRDGKNWMAHRFVFNVINGFLPKVVMHSCDNRCCVNPDHLTGGTQKDNQRDMSNKLRGANQHGKQKVRGNFK